MALLRSGGWLGWAGWPGLGLGWAGLGCGLGWGQRRQSRYSAASNLRKTKNEAPEPPLKTGKRSGTAAPNGPKTDQKRSVRAAENGTSESGETKPLPRQGLGWPGLDWASWPGLGLGHTKAWAGLWAGLGWVLLSEPNRTPQRQGNSGTAAPNRPKTDQKRCCFGAENGPSESNKREAFREPWHGPHQWAGLGLGLARLAGLGWAGLGWAGLGLAGLR